MGHRDRHPDGHHEGDREVHHRQGPRVRAGVPHHRPGASRRQDGDGAGRRQPRRPGQGALRVVLPRAVQGPLPAPGRVPQDVRGARLEHRRRPPAPQPDARLPRLPGLDRHRGVRRRVHPPARRQAEARRHPGRRSRQGDRRPGQQVLPQGARGDGRLPARHALRRSARGAAARRVPPELRLLAPHRRPRPRRRRRLLRAVRRAEDLPRDPPGRPGRSSRCAWTGRSTATSAAPWPR